MTQAKITLAVFLLSIAITGAFWVVLPENWRVNESTDYITFYEPAARQFLDGKGGMLPGGQPAIRYPPGYPLILAAVFDLTKLANLSNELALAGFILLCSGASSALVFLLANEIFDLRLGLAGAVLWMTYPFNLWLTKQPNSEIPFMVFLFASVFLFWRLGSTRSASPTSALAVGLLAGSAALIRPIAIGLPVILAGFMLFLLSGSRSRRLLSAGLLLAGALAVILPWELWIYKQTQQVIPLSSGGVLSAWDGLTYAVDGDSRFASGVPAEAKALMITLLERSKESSAVTFCGLLAILSEETGRNPRGALQLLGLKAARSWYGSESGRLERANAMIQGIYLAAIVWGGLSTWQSGGIKRRYLVFVLLLMLYFWLMTLSALSILRYMVPMMGLMVTLIPAGFVRFPIVRTTLDRWMPLK